MPNASPKNRGRYANQRQKVSPPVVTTAVLRKALRRTIQEVCDHMNEEHGLKVDRGTISAIENGHRGASVKMLTAYAEALGISPATIDTQYVPRQSRISAEEVA